MNFDALRTTYQIALPDAPRDEIDCVIDSALAAAAAKYPDFERFVEGIELLSTVFFTDHRKMPLSDYLETLYAAVKHADFTRPWRAAMKRPPVPPVIQ